MNELIHPALPFPLAPEGRKGCEFSLDADGTLTLSGEAKSDLFHDPAGGGEAPDAGFLVGVPPRGDFTLSARVTVPHAAMFDAGVLMVYADEDRFAKLCFELSPQGKPMAVSVVTRGHSDDSNAFTVDGDTIWLRITRIGRAWAFHTSADGARWDMLRYFTLDEPEQARDGIRVGFMAQSPVGEGLTATFAQIAFGEGAPANLRDGS